MKRLIAVAVFVTIPAFADENPTVAYCKARGDIERCKKEMIRGVETLQDGIAWIHEQELVGPWENGVRAIQYCKRRYEPNALAVGACVDGYLFDRR